MTLSIANTATGSSALFGGMAYLNENAAAIGAICAIFSLFVAIIFYVLNYRLKKIHSADNIQKITEEVLDQIMSQVPEAKDAISKVRDRRKHPKEQILLLCVRITRRWEHPLFLYMFNNA